MPPLAGPDALRFARQIALPGFGEERQQLLQQARVLVIGAGGLGSAVLPTLAAAGIGTLGIVDDDAVEATNLHRQTLHTAADVGRRKVDSAADRLEPLATGRLVLHAQRLTTEIARSLAVDYDLLVDGSDNFATRYLADDVARELGIPLVWGAVSQYGGHAGVVLPDGPRYRDLFPIEPAPGDVLSCADGGVLPSVCSIVGAILATETLKVLTGVGEPLSGRVTSYDALTGRFREIPFQVAPGEPSLPADRPDSPDAERIPSMNDAAAFPTDDTTADEVDAAELKRLLDSGAELQLVDVREPWEVAVASIPGAVVLPLGSLPQLLDALDPEIPVVAHCHHGVRSERALQILRNAGFDARHLKGGIDEWSRSVDPSVPRY